MLTPAFAYANLQTVTAFGGTASGTSAQDVLDAIELVVNAILTLVGIIAVIFVIIGGVRYITSQGDESAVAQAKLTIIYALFGIIIVILSAVLVNIIISAADGNNSSKIVITPNPTP